MDTHHGGRHPADTPHHQHQHRQKQRFVRWAASMARLDPRIRIYRFFQGIAQHGERKLHEATIRRQSLLRLENDNHHHHHHHHHQVATEKEILTSCFHLASVFTVWRPCSNMAISKMMQGKGVGKGLDIKGKSARTGILSAYVPFLQIHTQRDKHKMDLLPRDARVKIFYPSESTRDLACQVAIDVRDEMEQTLASLQDSMSITMMMSQHSQSLKMMQRNSYLSAGSIQVAVEAAITSLHVQRRDSDEMQMSGHGSCSSSNLTTMDQVLQERSNVSFEPILLPPRSSISSQLHDSSVRSSQSEQEILDYCTASQRKEEWEMTDSSVFKINDYAQDNVYGIELPERLLWEAFVLRQANHCQQWQLQCQHNHHNHHHNPLGVSNHCPPPSNDNSTTFREKRTVGFAELLMEQMMLVADSQQQQQQQHAVIEWVDESNPQQQKRNDATEHNTRQKSRRRHKATSSWSFVIVDQQRFVEQVLIPINQRDNSFESKYSCFVGKLRRCGFQEQTTGTGYARFRHVYFQKDRPELCALIGSEHDTGRDSIPSFQDANFRSLRKNYSSGSGHGPRVVLWNSPNDENPLCPHNLLMAYEEHGRVMPVVSDFDGFLVGTKRIHFDTPLPPEQVELMKSSIKTAQEILKGNAVGSSWDEKWKYAGRDHFSASIKGKGMPRYGYGDIKSYRLMESAARQLAKLDGAVRHGAECFNYEYPQEMDSSFLIISDSIKGKVRWEYVDTVVLLGFLEKQIEAGFTFPLNPKWILCDPGWSQVYDKLLNSENPNIQESMNVWFPPESGIRDMIKTIQKEHPTAPLFDTKSRRQSMGLPTVARYRLPTSGTEKVELFLDLGSAVQFSRPGLRSGLVCATNESCVPVCGGVTQAVIEAGGRELLSDAKNLPTIKETWFGPIRCVTGDAKIVFRSDGKNYGNLDVGHVIWAVGPSYGETYSSDRDTAIKDNLLRTAYLASMERAKEHELEALAFSLISAGKRSSRWDPERALRIAMRTLRDCRDFGSLREIHLCAFTADSVSALEAIAREFGMS